MNAGKKWPPQPQAQPHTHAQRPTRPQTPGVLQPKATAAAVVRPARPTPPAAPPVYRPQPTPTVLQTKTHAVPFSRTAHPTPPTTPHAPRVIQPMPRPAPAAVPSPQSPRPGASMGRVASPSAHARPAAATPPARPVSHPSDAKGRVSPLKHGPAVSVIQAAKRRRKKFGEDDGDNSEDETYFERKKNTNKIQRPKFKRDCYERLSVRMNVTQTDGTVAPIKGRTPYFQFDYNGQTVYLDKTYREMRPNKKTKEWKKIDKDHLVNHIALVAAAKELELQGNYEPYQIDYGFALAYRSTKNLSFIPKDSHKSKTTYRLHSVPTKQKKQAKEMIEWKISRKDETDNLDNPRLWQELQNQHQRGKPPSWSYTHYTTS